MTTPSPQPGFAPAPVNSTQWNAQVVQAAAQKRIEDTKERTAVAGGAFNWIPDWISKPVESFGSFVHSVYSDYVSRPITAVLLHTYIGSAEANSMGDSWSNLFDGDIWDRAWRDAKHVSPGQAIEFGVGNFFGDMRKEMTKPVIYKPVDQAGKRVVDQYGKPVEINLNKTGYIWDNPDAVKVHFDSGAAKWISGGLDAYIGWYADPLAAAGKGVGMARNIAYVRPAVQAAGKSPLIARGVEKIAEKAGIIEPSAPTVRTQQNLTGNAFTGMGNLIEKQKAKLGQDGFSEWVTNQNWAKNSADSGALANALGRAADRGEIDNILAVSLGDRQALNIITAKNAELGAQLHVMQRQKEGLLSSNPVTVGAKDSAKLELQLSELSAHMENIDIQRGILSGKENLFNSMKNGMYFNPLISPIASNFGQYARGLETMKAGDATGKLGMATRYGASLVYNNLYVRPIRLFSGTTWNAVRAPGHINVDAEDSHRALSASLQQANVFTNNQVRSMVSDYINADRANKDFLIQKYDRDTVAAIAAKHGLDESEADAVYKAVGGLRATARDGRTYSTAYINTADGGRLRADHVESDGSLVAVSPVLNSQLQNTHILTDYEHMNRMLKYSAGSFKKLLRENEIQAKAARGEGPLTMIEAQQAARQAASEVTIPKPYRALEFGREAHDGLSKLWKFNVLMRLGYGPRAIADDFMGQVARLGAANFFMDRTLKGGRNLAVRNWNKTFGDPTGAQQMLASIDSGISDLGEQITKHQAKIERISSYLPASPEAGTSYLGRGAKGRKLFNQRTNELRKTQQQLDDATEQLNQLRAQRNKIGETSSKLGDQYTIMPDGTAFPLPFEGPTGALYKDIMSGRRTIDSMMGGTATSMWNQFRKGDWRTYTSADGNDYISSYLRVVQQQFKNDAAAMAVLRGEDLAKWFTTPAGRAYRKASAMKNVSEAEHADRIESTVNHVLPDSTPEGAALREAVLAGKSDDEVAKLIKDVQANPRFAPDIQGEGVAYGMGKGNFFDSMNGVIDKFYDVMNRLPSETLSRNPLFFQLYRQHASDMWHMAKESGLTKISAAEQQRIAERARQLAVKDVKKLTFNMDYETKIAHAMRFIAPFFGPTQESFTRWGRIIADKPDILAHAANIYTSPIRAGHTVDSNGNLVDEDGYVHNEDGSKTLVPKSDMHIQFQAPQWLAKSIGMDQGSIVDMPIDTLNLVLQNDPWYNPGTGPWVQLPANWVALRSDPAVGDAMKKLGILQRVTQTESEQIMGSGPGLINTLVGSSDKDQQQRDMAYIMQSENYKWQTGMRSTEPTWKEVKDRVETNAYIKGWMKFAMPVSSSFKDPYQYFRDRYQELQKADPKTADQVFLAKYGDAAFAFTAAMTYDRKGLPATAEAVRADKKYSYLTDVDPDMAQLIIGEYSSGEFSQTAYVQQMRSGERVQLSAQEIMNKAQANQGWAQYDKYMNIVNARLKQAGFQSFNQKGAEKFDTMRKAVVTLFTEPVINGKQNPMYNEQFAKQFLTIDRSKDDRIALAMNKIVQEKTLIQDPMRSDIRSLASYMDYRNSIQNVLTARGKTKHGSADIKAKSNTDLRIQFSNAVSALAEQDTKFESLYNRWLSRDMYDQHNPMG